MKPEGKKRREDMKPNKEQLKKMRQESDRHVTVTDKNGRVLIDDMELTDFGKRELGGRVNKQELYEVLCERDGRRCHYCGIEEKDVVPLWGRFYGQDKRGRRLEFDRKDNEKDYHVENCVLVCAVCDCAKSDKFTYEEFRKVGDVMKKIWEERKNKHTKGGEN